MQVIASFQFMQRSPWVQWVSKLEILNYGKDEFKEKIKTSIVSRPNQTRK